jgi:hypothetical protein
MTSSPFHLTGHRTGSSSLAGKLYPPPVVQKISPYQFSGNDNDDDLASNLIQQVSGAFPNKNQQIIDATMNKSQIS